MSSSPRILIVTAAFGEGHNSAARNLALALDQTGAITRVSDPCVRGAPILTEIVSRGYRFVTTRLPKVWEMIYRSTDRCDFNHRHTKVMRSIERDLGLLIDEFRPDALVSTYPLYPYFMKRIPQGIDGSIPIYTVVTDSIEINAAWLRAPSDYWMVTDGATKDAVVEKGLSAEQVVDTGFCVNPSFATLSHIAVDDLLNPFRILYFPTAHKSLLTGHGEALLNSSPNVVLTIVMGRMVRRLYRRAKKLQAAYPGRVKLIGWTRKVPQLLSEHHMVVGKAGGATVHEAIAACCPMLIHHLVPGQEEGNLRLLESIGAGGLADKPSLMEERVGELLRNDGEGWRAMKRALVGHGRNAGAIEAARFILEDLKAGASKS